MPNRPDSSPLIIEPWVSEAISTRAISTMVKYSHGPKVTAQSARVGASETRKIHEITPPIKDDMMPKPSARPGSPF